MILFQVRKCSWAVGTTLSASPEIFIQYLRRGHRWCRDSITYNNYWMKKHAVPTSMPTPYETWRMNGMPLPEDKDFNRETIQFGRPERRHLRRPITLARMACISNAGSSQLNNGMIARFYQSNQNIGSEAGNVTRMRSQYPPCQYMEDSQLPAVRTYPSANPYAGSSAMPSNQFTYGFNRYRNMLSSCEFAAPAWGDGNSQNHDSTIDEQLQPASSIFEYSF